MDGFCRLNGWLVKAGEVEIFKVMLALAAGEAIEEKPAEWIEAHLVPMTVKP